MPDPKLRSLTPRAAWILLVLGVCPAEGPLTAQLAHLRVQENFRAEPQGTVLGHLRPGAEVRVESRQGQWVQATVEAWVWTRSLQVRREDPYDLVVSADEGENLRAGPSGEIVGHLVEGALLEELERRPGWILCRRTGWIWGPSLEILEESSEPPAPTVDQWIRSGRQGVAMLSGPDGDTVARTRPGAELRVLAREGNWTRVRMEGWVWRPVSEEEDVARDTVVFTDVTPEELTSSAERFTGRVVSLSLQFISLERAEKVRTDFYEGEPFLLTRALSGERSFVYVAVPPDRLPEVEGITPLERINVVGRVRTVASKLTGNPVLELLDIYRAEDGG